MRRRFGGAVHPGMLVALGATLVHGYVLDVERVHAATTHHPAMSCAAFGK
ncbi:hypothetical protein [Pendulispora albinea]|uniref:Uncharacterized protein n=1 Tax=Pendulispora albinea TaxID=2741071 RepID=A0ABZ2LRN7_9BACT